MKNIFIFVSCGFYDYSVWDQIFDVVMVYFSCYGYEKMMVIDFVKVIGFFKVYIYKFFDFKQVIGEVICVSWLEKIMVVVSEVIVDVLFVSEKLCCLFWVLIEVGSELFFEDCKLYDIVVVVVCDKWFLMEQYVGYLQQLIG